MCFMLYLGSTRPLPTPQDDAQYPDLSIRSINGAHTYPIDRLGRSVPNLSQDWLSSLQFVYDVAPAGLCGCYFEHPDRGELEAELEEVPDSELRSWVSTVAYPDLDGKAGARRWWERKHTAVKSLGWFLSDHVQDGPLVLYVVWGDDDMQQRPTLEQQTITPTYFTHATSLAWPEHMLFTIVAEETPTS